MAGRAYYDRVMERSITTGTGTYSLLGAYTGFQTFAAVGDGLECYYCAEEINDDGQLTGPWEVGVGTYASSGTTLARTRVLRSSNANAAVNWSAGTRRIFLNFPADVSRGAVLLQELTASTSASLDFSTRASGGPLFQSDFDVYFFTFCNVLPATSTDDLWIRMGTGAGPTWDSGANYSWAYSQTSQIPNSAILGAAGDTKIKIAHSLSNTSTNGTSGELFLYAPLNTSAYKKLNSKLVHVDSAGNFINAQCAAQYASATALTGVRFLFSSGDITSGIIQVFGLAR